jgi:hypothetical protein
MWKAKYHFDFSKALWSGGKEREESGRFVIPEKNRLSGL